MTTKPCPACGAEPNKSMDGCSSEDSKYWHCGSYGWGVGNFHQSKNCTIESLRKDRDALSARLEKQTKLLTTAWVKREVKLLRLVDLYDSLTILGHCESGPVAEIRAIRKELGL